MRSLPTGLLLPIMTVMAGCALIGPSRTSPARGGLRRFYLTKGAFQGNRPMDVCGHGYHMASRFELLDLSVLDYDSSTGLVTEDSGAGPPSKADVYSTPGPIGWVRTGGASKFSGSTETPGSASTNCAAWSTNSSEAYGTVAYLTDRFTAKDGSPAAVWDGGAERCDRTFHVWCVEDRPTSGNAPSGFGRGRHRRRSQEQDEPGG